MEKLNTNITKATRNAENAQQLLDKKESALERQIENQDFATQLADSKKYLVEIQKELAQGEADIVTLEDQITRAANAAERGELKINKSILGLNIE